MKGREDPPSREARASLAWLICILLLGVGLRYLFSNGFIYGADDVTYSRFAYRLAQGDPLSLEGGEHHMRFGLIVPLAFLYKVFGVVPVVNSLFPMTCALALGIVIYLWASGVAGRRAGLAACLFYMVTPNAVFWSTFIFPDVPQSLMWTLGFYMIYLAEKGERHKALKYLLAGLIFAYGHMINVSMVYVLPVLGFYGLFLLLMRRLDWRILWTPGGFLGCVLLEMSIYYIFKGNFLYRYSCAWPSAAWTESIWAAGYPSAMSRTKFFLWDIFLTPQTFGFILPFTAIGIAASLKERRHILLCSWMLGYLLVSYANMLKNFVGAPRFFNSIAMPVLFLGILGIRTIAGSRPLVFRGIMSILVLASLVGTYRACMGTAVTRNDPLRKAAAFLEDKEGSIWTDLRVMGTLRFHWGFEKDFRHIPPESRPPPGKAYVVIDEVLVKALSGMAGYPMPPEWLRPPPEWKKLIHIPGYRPYPGFLGRLVERHFPRDRTAGVDIYQIGEGDRP